MMKHRARLALFLLVAFSASCGAVSEPETSTDITKLFKMVSGESWYGVYFSNKKKCGYARMELAKAKLDGQECYVYRLFLAVDFKMGNMRQKLLVKEHRYYKLTGELFSIINATRGMLGNSRTDCKVADGKFVVESTLGGRTTRNEHPIPDESLTSALAAQRLISEGKIGAELESTLFETTLGKPVTMLSKLVKIEDRVVGGVKTRIYAVESEFKGLGMKGMSHVTADGDLIETVVAGIFTLRKEPEDTAKDIKAAFDIVRAGIIAVDKPIKDGDDLKELKLRLSGIRNAEAMIDDDRQKYERGEGPGAKHVVTLTAAEPPAAPLALPMTLGPQDEAVAKWLKPSRFAQSDAPGIVKAAKKIVGGETDSFKAAVKIHDWVYENVDKVYLAAVSNAVSVLEQKKGDCSEHAVLFVALCRAAGIPTREVVGIGYSEQMEGFGYHAWGEVYVGKWIAMDPTWGQRLADPTHVKFGVGTTDALGTIAGLFGSLKIEVIEQKRK